ncbi:probable splicing factor YJU2B [Lampris incognitus]|uniref:probable splicing factor YJU2B n=1 Tax=Lampris incognitus TaxID=2546036 RepID=UPI0024B487F8|nr:probable splicing factor YJU2B [Lampris incognitus]
MGERKGTNKYYPPDFDPAKHGSLNGYHKTHPLRERARKLSQGILIIRFEMPYNIWCDGCKNHIGMGVRYNAEKKKVGNYYTTPIYRFRMKCHLCVNYIEMQTDPATCDYVIVSGASRKEERWDMADNEQILTTERTEKEKLETDAMYKLDHGGRDKEKLRKALPSLSEIQDHQASWKDDFQLNSSLRRKFRSEKKVLAEQEEKDNMVRKRTNLSIPLLPEKDEDKKLAALLTYQAADSYKDRQHSKRKEISSRSWFTSSSASSGGAAGSLLHKLGVQGKGAAVAKALGPSPISSPSPLIRRRAESSGSKPEPCATVTRRKSDPGTVNHTGTDPEVTDREEGAHREIGEPQSGQKGTETNGGMSKEEAFNSTEDEGSGLSRAEEYGKEQKQDRCQGGLTSLVADYSDSDSDPGQ